MAVAYNLTAEEQAELRDVFTKLDDNGRSLKSGQKRQLLVLVLR